HPMRRDYYAATAAHPTLTVDGAEQREATGRLLYWHEGAPAALGADAPAALGAEADVYPGVRFERHLRADAELLVDVVRVEADRQRELVLHLRADTDVEVRQSAAGTRSDWPGDTGLVGLHAACPAAVLSTGADLGPADDPQRSRPHLRWTVTGQRAVFASVYSPTGAAAGIAIEGDGAELTIHIERRDGPPVRWRVPDQEAEVAG
ncbi:MAG TPA: heparinase II/III family protein, partial [Pseudonocardia sp.]|nr:heparinase II/III family protein [Pseudonocardia sp.]